MNKILDGKLLSKETKEKLKIIIEKKKLNPTLAVIRIGCDEASLVYVTRKEKICKEIGIKCLHIHYDNDVMESTIIDKINELNNDKSINGIIVQLPIPKHLNVRKIINTILYQKDVDGLTDINMAKLINNEKCLMPCTPKGIIKLLNHYKIDVTSKNIVIVGRSSLVGKPLFNMLINMDATVTLCHSKTNNLESYTKKADILIVAVGKKHLITESMVKKNAILIDVGINRIDNKLYGDIDFDNVINKVKYITPVPGGVGPLTVIMLMENVLETILNF